MLSTHLTSEERLQLEALATELDGLPFVEKAAAMRARVRELRSRRQRRLASVPAAGSPAGERRAA